MSKSNDCLPKVYHGIETIPFDHDRNAPIVVHINRATWVSSKPCPKASIIALDPGERIASMPRNCIHVCFEDNERWLRNGVIAFGCKDTIVASAVPFPILCDAIRATPKEFAPLFATNAFQDPNMFVKACHDGLWDFNNDPSNCSDIYGPGAVLAILMQRAGKNSTKGWREQTRFVLGKKPKTDSDLAQVDRFSKFCRKLGLNRKDKRDFMQELDGLWAAYREAQL